MICIFILSLASVISSFAFQPELFRKLFIFSSDLDFWEAGFFECLVLFIVVITTAIFKEWMWNYSSQLWMTTDSIFTNMIENDGKHCLLCCNFFYLYIIIFSCLPSPCLDIVIL